MSGDRLSGEEEDDEPLPEVQPASYSVPPEAETLPNEPLSDQLEACHFCGRTFLPRPLRTHLRVCERNATRKRRVFNSMKQRVQGTDLAEFHRQVLVPGAPAQHVQATAPASTHTTPAK